ncbi:hypothetical protein FA15DRAFT_711063 [Coprinopsis marcescibilis]|uniref:Uncharacterized protein n=1 Tax=Coprinopsis marcescibilis TaxID=230819 RepID=A0A5C3KAQ3_COPMA|nr:hypothetical protein FA15DRAFT_711063 [Coprinopsis marcescibilis]
MATSHPGNFIYADGHRFYSPNCKRVVKIPAAIKQDGSELSPFQQGVRWENLRVPCRWSRAYGWTSFIPIDRHFGFKPFDTVAYPPPLEIEDGLYYHNRHTVDSWTQLDAAVHKMASILFAKYDPPAVFPYSIRGWKFQDKFKSRAKGRALSFAARDWFLVWAGLLSFMIAHAEEKCNEFQRFTKEYNRDDPSTMSSIKEWQEVLNPDSFPNNSVLKDLADSLPSSPICSFSLSTCRCGIFLDLERKEDYQPSVTWFMDRGVPVWFPWNSDTPHILQKLNMAYLVPPPEVLQQQSQNIAIRPPIMVPAALLHPLPHRSEQDLSNPHRRRHLERQEAAAKRRVQIAEIISKADASAEKARSRFSEKDRVTALNRAKHPPRTSAPVHVYEPDNDDESKLKLNVALAAEREDVLGDFSTNQSRYFPELNRWICCADLAPNEAGPNDLDEDDDFEGCVVVYEPEGSGPVAVNPHQVFPRAARYNPEEAISLPDFSDDFLDDQGVTRLEQLILLDMRLFYGFIAPIPYPTEKPTSSRTDQEKKNFLRWLGHNQNSPAMARFFQSGITDSMYKFYKLCLTTTGDVHPPAETWDIMDTTIRLPENLGLLQRLTVLPRPVATLGSATQAKGGDRPHFWFILEFGNSHPWSLVLMTAADVVTVCRISPSVGSKHANPISPDDIISFLVQRGIPFHTFQSSDIPPRHIAYQPTPSQLPRKPAGYQFTRDDYLQYQHTRDLMLSNPRMRAALLRGGIVWRLAYSAVSVSDVLDGPTGVPGLIVRDLNKNEDYQDDALTALEEDLIVGLYVCSTGRGNPPALKSWWPLADLFDKGENPGRWTHHQEAWYRDRLEAIMEGKAQLYSVRDWRSKLRGRQDTNRIQQHQEQSSEAFLQIQVQRNLGF